MKRAHIFAAVALVSLLTFSAYFAYLKQVHFSLQPNVIPKAKKNELTTTTDTEVIMGVMGNQTEKAELGRATWKFLHTMMGRYPETPTETERKSLYDFMMLFSTLYPCGECANHFHKLITEYPPQTSSRIAASQWLCAMHNKVNERLKKPIFECNNIESHYPCGCSPEDAPKL